MKAIDRIGKIYDGRWKVTGVKYVKTKSYRDDVYELTNIYNGNIITLRAQIVRKLERGETTVSKVSHIRLMKKGIKTINF